MHSDVCGPMPTGSFGGRRYFVTFMDDYYTRFCKVYFMRNKWEVFDKLKSSSPVLLMTVDSTIR